MCHVSLRLKEVQRGTHDFKDNKVPLFCSKTMEYQYFDVCCLFAVSLRLKEVQKGTHDIKYNKVPLFAQKPWNINTSISAATILALVPASRYYSDVT